MSKKLLSIIAAVSVFALPVFASGPESGIKVGATVTPFNPTHITGPLKGTTNCPPCTFGARPQVQVWVNADDNKNILQIARMLDKEMKENASSELKAFVVVLTDTPEETGKFLAALAERAGTKDVAFTYLAKTDKAVLDYKMNVSADVKNTIFVYRNKQVSDKFVNLRATEEGLAELSKALDKVTS